MIWFHLDDLGQDSLIASPGDRRNAETTLDQVERIVPWIRS
jgi:hypothetical protein